MNSYELPISIDDIYKAQQRLSGRIYKTGMPKSNYISEKCGGTVHLKFENMQRTGSFKLRGAYNKLSSLTPDQRMMGVVTCSAGNHAQGVSLSCAMLKINGKVVMPKKAPASKVAATRDYSAEVILHGNNFEETMSKVEEIIRNEGRIFIPPYNDPMVIAGQGTIGLEILQDLYDVDNVIVPIGGGGLISGIAVAIKSINPTINIIGVQATNVHGMAASYQAGELTRHRDAATIADGCDVAIPGDITFSIVQQLVDDIVLVTEEEIKYSMLSLIQRNKIIPEGAGALACAAILSGKIDNYIKNKKTVSIISGGNIDLSRISELTHLTSTSTSTR